MKNSILKVIPKEQQVAQPSEGTEGGTNKQLNQGMEFKGAGQSTKFDEGQQLKTVAAAPGSAADKSRHQEANLDDPKLIIEKLYSGSMGSDYAPASASKRERAQENLKVQTAHLRSNEKSKLNEPFDLSAENHSVQKSSTKHHLQAFSAKKAPVFVYHETKSTRKMRVEQKRVSSLQDSTSSHGAKPGSQRALDGRQPASALTKATAEGYCQFQDEVNTTDQDLRELRKDTEGDAGAEDHYFEEGALRYGLFNNDFDDDDKNLKRANTRKIHNINFFGQDGQDADNQECELRSQKNGGSEENEASVIDPGKVSRQSQSVVSSRRAQANPETESKNSKTSRVTSLNDLTLSADADSDDSSEDDVRQPSKPRSQQESGMSSTAIAPAVLVPAKPQMKSSYSISENSVDLTRPDGGSKPQISLKLGVNRKTPMKKQMSRLQMFQQKLLQSEDSIKIDTLQQKTQKLENKNAQSSISISLRSRASSRTLSKANPKVSPPDRRMNSTTHCGKYASGVDYSMQERGRLPRTPLSPPRQQQNGQQGKLLQRGSTPGGLGIITQGLRNQKDTNGGQNLNSETIVTNGQGGLRCFSSLLRNDAVTTNQGDSGDRKPETFNSPNLRSEGSRRSLRGLSAQQALQKSIKKLNKIKSTPVSSFDYNQSPSPSPDSNFELDEDLRTFEEKYKILETVVLGEGCSSVVKECVLRVTSPRPQLPGLNLGNRQSSQGSGACALGAGKYGSSPLVFGKNLVVKEDGGHGGRGSGSPPKYPQASGVLDGKSPEKLAGLRLKIVRCDQADPSAQDQQADPTQIEANLASFESPPGKQPAVRAGADASKYPTAGKGRNHSFGGLAGGSFLRLHEIAIPKINEVDEDKLPSTRRSQLEERFSSGNSKQIEVPDGKRKKVGVDSPSSSAGSSGFSEQQRSPSVTSDSPEAIEQQISQATKPHMVETGKGGLKLEIPKRELQGGESASADIGEKGQNRGPYEEAEDSASDAQSSDLEFIEAQEPVSRTQPEQTDEQVNRNESGQNPGEGAQNAKQAQIPASPGKSSPIRSANDLQSSQKDAAGESGTKFGDKQQTSTASASQPRFELGLQRALAGSPERSPAGQLQLCRKRSSSSPCNKGSAARRSKSPTKSPKPVILDPSPGTPPSLGQRLAVKIIRTNDVELIEVAYEEYKLLRSIFHDNIVKMHDAFYNQMKCTMYLVMDMVQGQSLTQMLEERQDRGGYDNERHCESLKKPKAARFTEQECRAIFIQLLDVIEYLSSEDIGVCHRDINPNNIMLDLAPETEGEEGNHLGAGLGSQLQQQCSDFKDNSKTDGGDKPDPNGASNTQSNPDAATGKQSTQESGRNFKLTLIDFNVAKRFVDPDTGNPLLMMTNTGTARYQAPEMLGGWMSPYDQRVDLWSAGAVLYYLLTGGIHAFSAPLQKDIEAAIREASYDTSLPQYQEISSSAKDLIRGLITVDVAKRLSVHEAKRHPWLLQE